MYWFWSSDGFCSPFAAAVTILQENPNLLCERGASLKRNLVIAGNVGDCCRICRPFDRFSLTCFFWAKAMLETFTFTISLQLMWRLKTNHPISVTSSQHLTIIEANHWKNSTISREVRRMRQFQIYLEMYCLDPSTLLVSLWKNVAFFSSQLALRLVSFFPSGPVRVVAL